MERKTVTLAGFTVGWEAVPTRRFVRTVRAEIDTNKVVEVPEFRDGVSRILIFRRNKV